MDQTRFVEDVGSKLAATVGEAIDRGFVPPLYLACVAGNGSMMYFRYTVNRREQNMDAEVLGSKTLEGGFTLPINIMLVDQRGEAANIKIDPLTTH